MRNQLSCLLILCLSIIGCDDKAAALAPGSNTLTDAQTRDASIRADASLPSDMEVITETDGSSPNDMDVQATDVEVIPMTDAEIKPDADLMDMFIESDVGETQGDAMLDDAMVDDAMVDNDMSGLPNETELCAELFACISNCGANIICAAGCTTASDEESVAQLLTLEACLSDNDCYLDEQIDETCANLNCRENYLGCFGADSLPPTPADLTGCNELADCDTSCANDNACRAACADAATPEDRLAYADYVRCVMNDGADACGEEYEACYGVAPQLSCGQLFDCINRCQPGDATCAPSCIENASETALDELDARSECLSNSTCNVDDYACRLQDCETALTACFGETIIPTGMNSCSALNECFNGCPDADVDCANLCIVDSSPNGYNQFFALIYCGQDNGCDELDDPDAYSACLADNCSSESNICFEDTLGQGTLSCSEMYDCVDTCAENDALCTTGCVENVSPEGLVQARAYESCFGATGCPENDYACELQTCSSEFLACFGSVGVPSGTDTCDELNTCLGLCNNDDDACSNLCIQRSAPAEYNEFITLVMCAENSGCNGNTECINSVCANEINQCQTVEGSSGLLDCEGYNDCLGDCNGDLFCQLDCENASSGQAMAEHSAIFDCAQLNFCTSLTGELDMDCVNLNCADELAVCFGAAVTPSGTGTCPQLFACIGLCADDQLCIDGCITATSPTSFDAAVSLSDCSNEFCTDLTDGPYAECIDTNCSAQELDCLAN